MAYVLEKQTVQLLLAVAHAHAVARVDDPDERVGLLEVVAPVGPQRALAADVPFSSSCQSYSSL